MSNIKKEGNILMIIALFIFMGMQPTIISKSISLFMNPMASVAGVSTVTFSAMVSISGVFAAFLAPVTGKLMKKWGIKMLMLVSAILSLVAFYGLTFVTSTNQWLFYVIGIVTGLSQLGLSNVVVSTIVTSWYPGKQKGTMLGLVMAGSNFFNFIWVNVIGFVLNAKGNEFYASLVTIFAIVMAVVSIPLILFVFKLNPSMDTTASNNETKEQKAPVELPGMTMKEALKTPVFWLFSLALVGLGIIVTGVQMHANNFLQVDCGASSQSAATIWSLAAPTAVLSNLGLGILFSKIGAKKTIWGLFALQVLMCVCLVGATKNVNIGAAATIFYGLAAGVATTAPAYLTNVMFGQKEYPQIYGFVMMIFFLGCTFGSIITASVSKSAGYVTMWWVDLVLVVIAYTVFLYAIAKSEKNIEENSK